MAIIEVKGLGKRYKGNDFYSLKNANFTIEEGDIVGLVGKNGSEKSTLLKLLAKSQNPTEGTVFFNGKDIFKEDKNYIVLSKKINNNSIIKILKNYSNVTLVTSQNNLLKNDINYINNYIEKNNMNRNDIKILFVIDEINDIIISKLYYFIEKYKIIDIKLNDNQNYKNVKEIVNKINRDEGTVIDIVDKIQQKNYNIILVFSKKQKFFYNDNLYILDYNNSDLDVCSNTYLIYKKHKQQFLNLFKLIDMDISRFEKTKLGKLYIHTSGIILYR